MMLCERTQLGHSVSCSPKQLCDECQFALRSRKGFRDEPLVIAVVAHEVYTRQVELTMASSTQIGRAHV